MAERRVKVNLTADVSSYQRDVASATTATLGLRRAAERFEDTYTARMDVNTRGADRQIQQMRRRTGALASSIAALGPAAVSAGGVAAGGLLGLSGTLGVVAAATGTAIAGFQGIGDALDAMRKYSTDPSAESLEDMRTAMANLTVEGQNFVRYLDTLRDPLRELRDVAQAGLLPGVESGLRDMMTLLPEVSSLVDETAGALGDIADRTGDAFNSDEVRDYIGYLENRARPVLDGLADTALNIGSGVAGMLRGFDTALGDDVLSGLQSITEQFAQWGTNLRFSSDLYAFGDYVREVGPQVGSTLGAIADAVLSIAEAAAPIGPVVLGAIEGIADAINVIASSGAGPPIAAIATSMGALSVALKTSQAIKGSAIVTTLGNIADRGRRAGGATGGVVTALGKLGPAVAIGAGVLGGLAIAYDEVRSKAAESAEAVARGSQTTQESFDEELRRLRDRNDVMEGMTQGYAAGQAIGEMTGKIDANAQALAEEREAYRLTMDGQKEYLLGLPPAERAAAQLAIAQNDYNDAVARFGTNSPQAIDAQHRVASATQVNETAQRDAARATQDHTDRMNEQADAFLRSRDTELQVAEAKDRFTEAIKVNGTSLDINTDKGRANRGALDDMAGAAWRDIEAKEANGASTQEVADLTDYHREQLVGAMEQLGFTKDAANRYAEQLGLIPDGVNTNFTTSGIDSALSRVGQLAVEIDGVYIPEGALPGPGERPGERSQGITGYATGGMINGPGGPTDDRIPAMLSDGEYVIRSSAARKLGRGKLDMINRGMLPGYATGGQVSMTKERENGIPRWVNLDFSGTADRIKADTDKYRAMLAGPAPGGGGSVERWRPLVLAALARQGQSAALANRVLMQINSESGGNPNAINLWDINAQRGYPSRGLLQTIPQTFAAYRDPALANNIVDPFANINASIRYAVARYGSLTAAYRGVGYSDGGVIPGSGQQVALAHAGERVLSRSQTAAFEDLVSALDRPTPAAQVGGLGGSGAGGRTFNYSPHQEIALREEVDLQLFNQRQDFAVRSAAF